MIDWAHAGTALTASFLASFVEFVEALTIVLAVGTVRGWKSAMVGTVAGIVLLMLLVLAFGPVLQRIPITTVQVVIGVLLVLFGMRWLRKAILRQAGVIGLHDEEAIYLKQTQALEAGGIPQIDRLDGVAVVTAFKAVSLEGLEVVFIVIATGATGRTLIPAMLGATVAGILVIIVGLALHKPLTRVPENTLKFAVGILLSAFGVFWFGEGLGFHWPGADLALLGLIVGFLFVSTFAVAPARRLGAAKQRSQA
jgi:uncharacterized membrane protein